MRPAKDGGTPIEKERIVLLQIYFMGNLGQKLLEEIAGNHQ